MARVINIMLLCAVLALSACATQQQWLKQKWQSMPFNREATIDVPIAEPSYVVVKSASETDKVLLYYRFILKLSAREYANERRSLQKQLEKKPDLHLQLRYILLLLRPGMSGSDPAQAAKLLAEVGRRAGDDSDRVLIKSFTLLVGDLLRLAEESQRLRSEVDSQKTELEHLRGQINALKSIEKSLHERDLRETNGETK